MRKLEEREKGKGRIKRLYREWKVNVCMYVCMYTCRMYIYIYMYECKCKCVDGRRVKGRRRKEAEVFDSKG